MKKIITFLKLLPILLLFSLSVPTWASSIICPTTSWVMTFLGPVEMCDEQKSTTEPTTSFNSSDKNKPEKPPFSFFCLVFAHLLQ
ncbi:hypothetical protein [Candidatus Regiella endosymbiont of Tuberolachnus salignus]|uniref:hypothetical protein n=1 Tax=Candidatus Regiella endosymbiont of Tuberolachnus salignus TaxID=3077956 RepID=UPI0030D397D7